MDIKPGKLNAIFFTTPIEDNWLGHQFSEVYKDNIFTSFVRGKKDMTIVEVGANLGVVSYYFAQFAKKVYALEPSQEHFMVLKKMIEFNELEDVIIPINKAIYTEAGQFPLFHHGNKTMYSLHKSLDDHSSQPEIVEAITLDAFFDQEKLEKVDLLKLDIEGSEFEVVGSESFRKVAPKINSIVIEYHDWAGRHPNQLKETLKSNGFRIYDFVSSAKIIGGQK